MVQRHPGVGVRLPDRERLPEQRERLLRDQGPGKVPEEELYQGGDAVQVLRDPGLRVERRGRSPEVEQGAEALDVGGDAGDAVDAVSEAVRLDEAGAADNHVGNWTDIIDEIIC